MKHNFAYDQTHSLSVLYYDQNQFVFFCEFVNKVQMVIRCIITVLLLLHD